MALLRNRRVKRFHCACGHRVFFDNSQCLACGRSLGFDPGPLEMVTFRDSEGGPFEAVGGARFRVCRNRRDFGNCNWLVPTGDTGVTGALPEASSASTPDATTADPYCLSCSLNEVIPHLERPGNLQLWTRVEEAKRRLLYTLLSLGLPVLGAEGGKRLRFRFLEDRRRNPDVREDVVMTGHLEGVITVNLAEADDAARNELRQTMQERYRTVLGHLRHEAGHYYFSGLTRDPIDLEAFRRLFGDERMDYPASLRTYYERGPRPDWSEWHLSAYAAAHPHEDFAETFAHYLHIVDALETAEAAGFGEALGGANWIERWLDLSVTLNELNRSLGADDPYPFVLSPPVLQKLDLIDRLVRRPA